MASKEKQANVNINNNGAQTSYSVTPDQIAKNKEALEQKAKGAKLA